MCRMTTVLIWLVRDNECEQQVRAWLGPTAGSHEREWHSNGPSGRRRSREKRPNSSPRGPRWNRNGHSESGRAWCRCYRRCLLWRRMVPCGRGRCAGWKCEDGMEVQATTVYLRGWRGDPAGRVEAQPSVGTCEDGVGLQASTRDCAGGAHVEVQARIGNAWPDGPLHRFGGVRRYAGERKRLDDDDDGATRRDLQDDARSEVKPCVRPANEGTARGSNDRRSDLIRVRQ